MRYFGLVQASPLGGLSLGPTLLSSKTENVRDSLIFRLHKLTAVSDKGMKEHYQA